MSKKEITNKNKMDDDCCYKAVFGSEIYKIRRLGRSHYICDYCGKDISMLWAFYQLSLENK